MQPRSCVWWLPVLALSLAAPVEARPAPRAPAYQGTYLVVVTGQLKGDLDEAALQATHDGIIAAMAPAARKAGDLAHAPYLGAQDPRAFMAVDVWNSLSALQRFYSDPKAQQALSGLFSAPPEIQVFTEAGWASYGARWYQRPAALAMVTAPLKGKNPLVSRHLHDAIIAQSAAQARRLGDLTHDAYLGLQDPTRFLAVDTWSSVENMQRFYADPGARRAFMTMFAAPPTVTIYVDKGWKSY